MTILFNADSPNSCMHLSNLLDEDKSRPFEIQFVPYRLCHSVKVITLVDKYCCEGRAPVRATNYDPV
jgi:hypothetical protein